MVTQRRDCHWDLIVTMDDATSAHYAMHFVKEEGTHSGFQGVHAVIEAEWAVQCVLLRPWQAITGPRRWREAWWTRST